MDRQITYPGQIPLETDLLNTNKSVMMALGKLAGAILGTSNLVNGLTVVPTSPATLSVNVNAGEIYSLQSADAAAYSSLASDTTPVVKQGIQLAVVPLSCPAPTTAGFSINYLIEATYQDSDTGLVTLSYYNAGNPSQAWSGPNNTGVQQATKRAGVVALQAKAGVAAATGSQTTPAVDPGYVALAVVTVANGQSTITAANIAAVASTQVMTQSLLSLVQANTRIRLTAPLTIYVSPSGADAAGNGLTATSPFQTITYAYNFVRNNYDLNGFAVTIQLANGTYLPGSCSGKLVGDSGALLTINGSATAGAVTIAATANGQNVIAASGQAAINISGITLTAGSFTTCNCLFANIGATIIGGSGIIFGTAPSGLHIQSSGTVILANYTITGGASSHIVAGTPGNVQVTGTNTVTGTPAFTQFAMAQNLGFILSTAGTSYVGSATGLRYNCNTGGLINSQGAGVNLFPGSSAGTTTTGGQYV